MLSKVLSSSLCTRITSSLQPEECSWSLEVSGPANTASVYANSAHTGNVYYITNICERDAKIFFAQARKMPEDIKDLADDEASEDEGRSRSRSAGKALRRESTGRASSDTVNAEEQPKTKSRRGTSAR